ncbi:MAG: radical SAM protein [Methanosarcinaceae archaeon]|nr:radical SAM protein [Methanosarcinaceae archaeon]
MKHIRSLCPECQAVIDAVVFEEDGRVFMEKTCNEHSTFRDVYWSDAALFHKFDKYWHTGSGLDNPMNEENEGCPHDCGICQSHKTTTILANIDVTNRCNMHCPVCFANAKRSGYIYEPSIEQIRDMMLMLRSEEPVPCHAVQFSGGEPTVRDDLPELVAMAHDLGFLQIQIATNGLRLAKSVEFGKKLMHAGLQTVYLQFDGVSEEPYRILRGFNAFPIKQKAIENCRIAGIKSIALVPTVTKGVNDHEAGDIIRFAADMHDVVKGVNFQPVSFTGRIDQDKRKKGRITIPDVIKLVEEQTDGEIPADAWYPVPSVVPISQFVAIMRKKTIPEFTIHPHCGAGTYVFKENKRLIPITEFVDVDGLLEFVTEAKSELNGHSSNLRTKLKMIQIVSSFIDKKSAPKSVDVTKLFIDILKHGTDEATKQFHRNVLFLGTMHFQDLYNIDLDRVQHCGIHYATPDGRVIPFCTYNTLHREEVEAKFSRPYVEL